VVDAAGRSYRASGFSREKAAVRLCVRVYRATLLVATSHPYILGAEEE
jgi:hypothetical protein